jgi:DNA-binding LacI/PurR family transcriptional regulator
LALDHLHSLGHRDIGFLGGPPVSPVALVREETYRTWMEERGLSPLARVWEGNFTKESGTLRGREILDAPHPPTALLAANDLMALGVLKACRERGVRVPGELSLVGYDNAVAGEYTDPGLTTVAQNAVSMGAQAVEFLFASLDGGMPARMTRIDPHLVLRESSGPHRG